MKHSVESINLITVHAFDGCNSNSDFTKRGKDDIRSLLTEFNHFVFKHSHFLHRCFNKSVALLIDSLQNMIINSFKIYYRARLTWL